MKVKQKQQRHTHTHTYPPPHTHTHTYTHTHSHIPPPHTRVVNILVVTADALVGVFVGDVVAMATGDGTKVRVDRVRLQCPEHGRRGWDIIAGVPHNH